ncbi:HAD family hydrolase [Blautia sp. XA-2221]|uniref:HAD family hydrolase n=1 Tax=Blautia sp. XA-2221 TaxID=2903961 RepID=UPI00237917DF|nr:HAD family hydrolase [Blautia sp. XA-2221]
MTKTVIFDIDNTLYDYDSAHLSGMKALTTYCIREFNISENQVLSCYGKAMKIISERIGTNSAAIHSRMLRFQCMTELLSQPLFPHVENMYHTYWDTMITDARPSPGIQKVLEDLKARHIRIGIGTDMTASIQFKKLEKFGFSSYIDFIVTSQEAGVEKPHPHFFEVCLEKAGCTADSCVFIGDNLKKDVQGACDCGLFGVWYSQERLPEKETKFPVITTFTDLKKFLQVCKIL